MNKLLTTYLILHCATLLAVEPNQIITTPCEVGTAHSYWWAADESWNGPGYELMVWTYPGDLFGHATPVWRLTTYDSDWNFVSETWVDGCSFDFTANSFDPGSLVGLGGYVDGVGNVDHDYWTDASWKEAFFAFGGSWQIIYAPAPLATTKGRKLGHSK
jgi:hypothetical protein